MPVETIVKKPRAKRAVSRLSKEEKADAKQNQGKLEKAILLYQSALETSVPSRIDEAYREVCNIYPPLNFAKVWFQKYRHLYDSRDDFVQDYLCKFCEVLSAWKPRDTRPESRYGGSGEFKNYFWGSLHNYFTNMVKRQAAGRRNIASRCPICDIWCQAISTHLLKKHTELLWEQMEIIGMPIKGMTACPFCKSHKIPKSAPCEHQKGTTCASCLQAAAEASLQKHLLSMHSPLLFERFREIYPSHNTMSSKPSSVYFGDDSGEKDEVNLYDITPDTGRIDALFASSLSPIQKKIIEKILIQRAREVHYDSDVYNCSLEEFDSELEDLRTKMLLCGLEE